MVNNYIMGGSNTVVTGGSNLIRNGTIIETGNLETLRKYLVTQGIAPDDVAELEETIREDGKPEAPDKLGGKATAWIGNMTSKAVSGVWNTSLATAPQVLYKAICEYQGWK